MAKHNLDLISSTKQQRKDLIQFWQYCLVLSQIQPNDLAFPSRDLPYSLHIQAGIQLWMRHFLRIHDIQSVAMFSLFLLGLTVWYAPKALLDQQCWLMPGPGRSSAGPHCKRKCNSKPEGNGTVNDPTIPLVYSSFSSAP
ncbi:hypothetical protein Ciccas_013819 [Cichlidogyrus casuarinus]|uniref:Uncharacterized protein n=1 Tax=Cichlidogyrus casuarinus TaxID=1844966 RepID=A0ABD2PMM3_9PLAT